MSSRTAPSSIFSNYNFYTNITILAAVSLDVESYSAFINFFHKCNFYTNISILAAVSHDDERAAPSSIFSDEIDCVKFITISKATKEKRQILVPKCFFLAVVYFYIGVMYSCVRGHNSLQLLLAKVRIQYTKIAFRNLAYRLWNWGHYIANSPSCENGTSFQFFKI